MIDPYVLNAKPERNGFLISWLSVRWRL